MERLFLRRIIANINQSFVADDGTLFEYLDPDTIQVRYPDGVIDLCSRSPASPASETIPAQTRDLHQ